MSALFRTAAVVITGIGAGVAAIAVGTMVWTHATSRLVSRLGEIAGSTDRTAGSLTFDGRQLEGLPPPVARYFAFALTPGQRLIRRAHLEFTGTFATRPDVWSPFTARQLVTAVPPGFVWDARIAMIPLVPVRVRDSYVGGEGAMRAKVAALVPLIDQHGTPEMAAASLQRFLAEAVWLPTALLPRDGLSWSGIDETHARVTVSDGATTVSLDVEFGPRGEIQTVSTMRYRDVKGTPVLTPWVGHHTNYQRMRGMVIPTAGEVAWVLPEGRMPYWRGQIVDVRYE